MDASYNFRYDPSKVDPEFHAVFATLEAEFGADYEIWGRADDYGRTIEAGVVARSGHPVVHIPLQQGGLMVRTALIPADLAYLRNYLASGAPEDFWLSPP